MNPDITCSSCRKVKCESCFKIPNSDRMFKTCVSCRLRKIKTTLSIEDTIIKDDVKVEDNQDELIVTPGNRNRIIHMTVKCLEKDENVR